MGLGSDKLEFILKQLHLGQLGNACQRISLLTASIDSWHGYPKIQQKLQLYFTGGFPIFILREMATTEVQGLYYIFDVYRVIRGDTSKDLS